MECTINRYGEMNVTQNTLNYTIPFSNTSTQDLNTLGKEYEKKKKELSNSPYYLFTNQVSIIRDRFCFSFHLKGMKAYYYIRQLHYFGIKTIYS